MVLELRVLEPLHHKEKTHLCITYTECFHVTESSVHTDLYVLSPKLLTTFQLNLVMVVHTERG
jgi:hypothetical protein